MLVVSPLITLRPGSFKHNTNKLLPKSWGLNRNSRLLSPTTRRAFKARKKSNIVKGQWTVDEDRYILFF
jgi:hypothetical protein